MRFPPSNPSKQRTIMTLLMIGPVFLYGVAFKVLRDHHDAFVPSALVGYLPNLLAGIVFPLVIFASPKQTVSARDLMKFVGVAFVTLLIYELTQILMPQRTFDWTDIAASAVGVAIGWLLGFVVFFVATGKRHPKQQ